MCLCLVYLSSASFNASQQQQQLLHSANEWAAPLCTVPARRQGTFFASAAVAVVVVGATTVLENVFERQ